MAEKNTVLLVANQQEEIELVRNGFASLGIQSRLEMAADVEQAMRYLRGEGPYWDRERFPAAELVLLDWNLAGSDRALQRIRKSAQLKNLPVIVLIQRDDLREIREAYKMGANSFLVKGERTTVFNAGLKDIANFWLVELRSHGGGTPLTEQELREMRRWGQEGTELAA